MRFSFLTALRSDVPCCNRCGPGEIRQIARRPGFRRRFLLYETSGLMGRTPVTTTAVAVVNGEEIHGLHDPCPKRNSGPAAARAPDAFAGRHASDRERVFDQMVSASCCVRISPSRDRRQRRRSPRVRSVCSPPWITRRRSPDGRPVRFREVSAATGQSAGPSGRSVDLVEQYYL
jgi:hypothetical protein